MPELKLESVVFASEAFQKFEASNLLDSRGHRPYKGKPGVESNIVVIKLAQQDTIRLIDLGNEFTASLKILVSRSGNEFPKYSTLLDYETLMTPDESKKEKNGNKWFRFTKKNFKAGVCEKTWDLIKIVCKQPFNSRLPFGLSFLSVTGGESILHPRPVSTPLVCTLASISKDKDNESHSNSVKSLTISSLRASSGTRELKSSSRNRSPLTETSSCMELCFPDDTVTNLTRRLNREKRQKTLSVQNWKDKLQREKQALSRSARLIRRNLVKSSSSSNKNLKDGVPINPADISLFNPLGSMNSGNAPTRIETRGRKRKDNNKSYASSQEAPEDPSSNVGNLPCDKSADSDDVEWPSLFEYMEIEDGVFTELMDGLDLNVEQLINIDERTLLQYEGESIETGPTPARFVKLMKGDDDEIVILKVIPSTHTMSWGMEEKPMIKRGNISDSRQTSSIESKLKLPVLSGKSSGPIRARKCRRWNWEKENYEDVVVSRISQVGWNVRKNAFWEWDDEWTNAKAVCRKCELRKDRRREDNGASLIFRTPNPHAGYNNNLSNIPMSPRLEGDISGFLEDPILLNDGDADEINTETLYESMNFDNSGLVDLGYIEDL